MIVTTATDSGTESRIAASGSIQQPFASCDFVAARLHTFEPTLDVNVSDKTPDDDDGKDYRGD
jgi:hypothetical protein